MAFRLQIRRHVYQQLNSCGLPDPVLVEAFLRLREQLADDPQRHLQRIREPFDGMAYGFNMIDPGNRFCEHHFIFHVLYGADEESLIVVRLMYLRVLGA